MSLERTLRSVVLCGCLAPLPFATFAQATQTAPGAQPAPQQSAGSNASQPAITNDDVVKLVKAGMADTTVVAVIQKGPDRFDTSPTALIALKKAGVSDTVIGAMITAPQSATATPSAMTSAVSTLASSMTQPAASSMPGATVPMPATTPGMTATPAASTGMPSTLPSMNPPGAPATNSMGGMPAAPAGMGTTATSAMPMGGTTSGMGATAPMGGMPGTAAGTSPAMGGTAPGTSTPPSGATGMATTALQTYAGNAMPAGTASLAGQGIQALASKFGTPSVRASGIPLSSFTPLQIEAAIYAGTHAAGQVRGLTIWDGASSSASSPFLHSLESAAAQEAKLPVNTPLPNFQKAPSGFGIRILTPTEWLVQLAGDDAAKGTPLQPTAVTPDMTRPVLHVLGYYSAPGTLGGVSSVALTDSSHKNMLQASASSPFFAQGVIGMLAEFPLDALAQLRQQDPEFEVIVTASNGKTKNFKIKKQQFAGLP